MQPRMEFFEKNLDDREKGLDEKQVMESIYSLALAELTAKKKLTPLAFIYTKEKKYIVPYKQFENTNAAKIGVAELLKDKNGEFYIVAGVTKKKHPIMDMITTCLNVVMVKGESVKSRVAEFLLTGDVISVLKVNEFESGARDTKVDDVLKAHEEEEGGPDEWEKE